MAGVNKVILVGRLGKDPEVRNFQNGGKVVNLRLATSEVYKDKEGTRQERTEWHAISIFNERLGEVAEKYLRKGGEVYIEGQLETRKWTDAQGAEKYTTEVVLRQFRGELQMVGSRQGRGGDDTDQGEQQQQRGQGGGGYSDQPRTGGGGNQGGRGSGVMDDDIPFACEWR